MSLAGDPTTLVSVLIAAASGVAIYLLGRRTLYVNVGFNYLDKLTNGEIPRRSSILFEGDPGSAAAMVILSLLHRDLKKGIPSLILSYDTSSDDIIRRGSQAGLELKDFIVKKKLAIIDCYSPKGSVEDPYNLTKMSMLITQHLKELPSGEINLLLDSLVPLINQLDSRSVISFLRELAARISGSGGNVYVTISPGALPREELVKLEALFTGLIETRFMQLGRKKRRFIVVRWIADRKIPDEMVMFELKPNKGVVFKIAPK